MKTFHAINPVTGAQLEPAFTESSVDDVDQAFIRAEIAFGDFRTFTGARRAALLRAIAREIENSAAPLTERAHAETALPKARLEGERARTIAQLELMAATIEEGAWLEARIDRADAARTPAPRPALRRMLLPIGPVAVFGASNFPLAFGAAGNDVAAALAAGCTVVYKAHPAQPGTSRIMADAIARALVGEQMPADVFALLQGWSHETGLAMVRHPLCRAVGFTGSLRAGRALFDAAAARPEPIPVYAEMGSVNPVFVFPSALANPETAALLGQSVTLGVGQFCTNPGIIVAPRDDRFRAELAQRIRAAGPGVPLYQQLGAAYGQALTRATELGAECVGEMDTATGHMQPQLLVADLATLVGRPELRAEMFGPASILVTADVAEFQHVAAVMEGQLTATVFASKQEIVQHAALLRGIERKVGRLIFNGVPTGVEVSHAMQHGGPYPASTDARSTSVGSAAISRFARPVCYQNFPEEVLPPELQAHNPLRIWRLVDGQLTRDPL